jgi:hypothetical protein
VKLLAVCTDGAAFNPDRNVGAVNVVRRHAAKKIKKPMT